MLKWNKSILIVGSVGLGLLLGSGCPKPSPPLPDYLPFFLVSPASLDFGTDETALTLSVSKSYTAQPLPTFTVSNGGTSWISVAPPAGNSTGPSDPAYFTVTVDRSKLPAGPSTANVVVSAPGIATKTVPVTVTARISADFSASTQIAQIGDPVSFADLSAVNTGEAPINSWTWNFGDGGFAITQNPVHAYALEGLYTVTLTVSNGTLSDTETKVNYMSITGVGPTADFDADDTTPAVNQVVNFTDLSDPGSSPITDWFWNFGDGVTDTVQNPSHMYTAVATYTVYLSVTTIIGTDSETKTNFINVHSKKLLKELGSGR